MRGPFSGLHRGHAEHGFRDRVEAGRLLSQLLSEYKERPDVVVLGLPRGGIPVAFEVAKELRAPLDVFLVRKIGVPGHEELALGAVASGGVVLVNQDVASHIGASYEEIKTLAGAAFEQLREKEQLYRADLQPQPLKGKIAILVDDGLATGSSMQAAVAAARRFEPARVVVAVPVAAPQTCQELRTVADDVVCVRTPAQFFAVGAWYDDFKQIGDDEVVRLLHLAAAQLHQ